MKKHWQSLVFLFLAWLAVGAPASAVPVVAADSRYNVYVEATESANVYFINTAFDGVEENALIGDRLITVTESETVEGVNSRIRITLSSATDLFPAANDAARFGIGTGGDPLDLLLPVSLLEARVLFYQEGEVLLDSIDELVGLVSQTDPWDGSFPNVAEVLEAQGIGGQDVRAITFEFLVGTRTAEVPEPGIMMMGGIGLLAFAASRRRKAGAKRP